MTTILLWVRRRARRSAVLFLAATLAALTNSAAAQPGVKPPVVQPGKFPELELPQRSRGNAAVTALGNRLPAVAAYYGKTPSEFARLMREDPSLWIDRKGRALYIEEYVNATAEEATDILDPAPYPLSETFNLQSKPDAPRVVYLDFDGHTTVDTSWNAYFNVATINSPPYDTNGDRTTFSDSELTQIQRIWRLVADDFAAFNVNVTTKDPGPAAISRSGSGDGIFGTRVVITRDNFASCGCGGFAYLRAFDDTSDYYKPAFVFNTGVKGAGEAATHEVGHNLGLNHDGVVGGSAYYAGHGSGSTGWAPIMGVGYQRILVQWSRGEYSGANNTEDDLAIMQQYGAPLRNDDHGDAIGTASDMQISSDGVTASLAATGVISGRSDRDVFRLLAGSGDYSLSVTPPTTGPNLDIRLTLRDSAGNTVNTGNPTDTLAASISGTLAAGEYFLEVDGVGKGDPLGTGYSDYASIGNYAVTGTVADSSDLAPPTAVAAAPDYQPGVTPLYVAFYGDQSVNADQWAWDFGDGNVASGANVNHSFAAPGSYTVTLTVTSPAGLTDSDSVVIEVVNRDPVAAISATPTSGTSPLPVDFSSAGSFDADSTHAPEHGIVSYYWDFGDGMFSTAASPTHEYQQAGSFAATLTVTDSLGATGTALQQIDVAPAPVSDQTAYTDASIAGTVTGDVSLTASADGARQRIREVESGGKKQLRYSYLEHRWYFTLPAGDSTTLYVTGWQDASADGDVMQFSYRLNGGGEVPLPLALGSSAATSLATLPSSGGDLELILRDSDRSAGSRSLDSAWIDELRVRVSNLSGDAGTPPAAPSGLAATSVSDSSATLTWSDNGSDETGFRLYRSGDAGASWQLVATLAANATSATDSGLQPLSSYDYRVTAFNAAGESAASTASGILTQDVSGIELSGAGSKRKGSKIVDLSWIGTDAGLLYRNGVSLGTVTGGSYSEDLGKGSGSYRYQLCSASTSGLCSNEVAITF